MNGLTKEDWVEIYYALVDKQARIDEGELGEDELENSGQEDASTWAAHLGAIIDKIGPDGENMFPDDASPELLASLKWIVRCAKIKGPAGTTAYLISGERMKQACDAIAKAEGRK